MRRFAAWLCALLSAIGVNACDYLNMKELEPGVSTALEVRDRFGEPGMEWRNGDGSITWEYSRQPEGTECFMITIGVDGVLRRIDQVLNEESFARVARGMNADEVRRLLGRAASSQFFALKNETVWEWKFDNGHGASGEPTYFTVAFNADGRVAGTGRYTRYRNR